MTTRDTIRSCLSNEEDPVILVTLILVPVSPYLISSFMLDDSREHMNVDRRFRERIFFFSLSLSFFIRPRPFEDRREDRGKGRKGGKRGREGEKSVDRKRLSLDRSASIFCHGTRSRTLCITRGKENVETARGTRHTIASRSTERVPRAALHLCAHMYLDWLLLT